LAPPTGRIACGYYHLKYIAATWVVPVAFRRGIAGVVIVMLSCTRHPYVNIHIWAGVVRSRFCSADYPALRCYVLANVVILCTVYLHKVAYTHAGYLIRVWVVVRWLRWGR
jgi:hypothetical protein